MHREETLSRCVPALRCVPQTVQRTTCVQRRLKSVGARLSMMTTAVWSDMDMGTGKSLRLAR